MSAFWDKFTKKQAEGKETDGKSAVLKKEDSSQKVVKKEVAKKDSKKKKKGPEDYKGKSRLVNDTIIEPIVSEDAMNKEVLGKYVFKVKKKTSKKQIAQAVEAKYQVEVVKVNCLNQDGKKRNFRQTVGRKNNYKKAIVTIEKNQKIVLFSE